MVAVHVRRCSEQEPVEERNTFEEPVEGNDRYDWKNCKKGGDMQCYFFESKRGEICKGKGNVAIIGSGIIGLSTAVRLQDLLEPEANIVVFSKSFPKDTTSDVAGGMWGPAQYGDTPMERVLDWSKRTWDFLLTILGNPDHAKLGVYFVPFYQLFEHVNHERPEWADILLTFQPLEKDDVQSLYPKGESGYFATSLMVEGPRMVDFLFRKFVLRGGKYIQRHVKSFDEVAREGFQVIVNCSGVGARDLCADAQVFPFRGQIREVQAPWIRMAMCNGTHFILPKQDVVLLGGADKEGDWCAEVRKADTEYIMEGCCSMDPALKDAPVVRDRVGIRPGRTEVRLEVEKMKNCTVVHNYGHGGSGLTFFWGCAEDAAILTLNEMKMSPACRL